MGLGGNIYCFFRETVIYIKWYLALLRWKGSNPSLLFCFFLAVRESAPYAEVN